MSNQHLTQTDISVTINGDSRRVPAALTVATLLAHLGLESDRVAVELNRSIVGREQWASAPVSDGANLEIVQFVGGG